mmetsp:Transcript_27114/g.80752  ORF Transcript_27114/g.80752 Transcript_27114/m.80752 type:complete len:204 (+) Transcript_27114:141-752(+)
MARVFSCVFGVMQAFAAASAAAPSVLAFLAAGCAMVPLISPPVVAPAGFVAAAFLLVAALGRFAMSAAWARRACSAADFSASFELGRSSPAYSAPLMQFSATVAWCWSPNFWQEKTMSPLAMGRLQCLWQKWLSSDLGSLPAAGWTAPATPATPAALGFWAPGFTAAMIWARGTIVYVGSRSLIACCAADISASFWLASRPPA